MHVNRIAWLVYKTLANVYIEAEADADVHTKHNRTIDRNGN